MCLVHVLINYIKFFYNLFTNTKIIKGDKICHGKMKHFYCLQLHFYGFTILYEWISGSYGKTLHLIAVLLSFLYHKDRSFYWIADDISESIANEWKCHFTVKVHQYVQNIFDRYVRSFHRVIFTALNFLNVYYSYSWFDNV